MKRHITAFYFETLVLILSFVAIILVLSGVFGAAEAKSADAAHLTKSVSLAENAAEAVSASATVQELQALLGETGDTALSGDGVTLRDGEYRVEVSWEPDGALVESHIAVYWQEQEIYSLDTGVLIK